MIFKKFSNKVLDTVCLAIDSCRLAFRISSTLTKGVFKYKRLKGLQIFFSLIDDSKTMKIIIKIGQSYLGKRRGAVRRGILYCQEHLLVSILSFV